MREKIVFMEGEGMDRPPGAETFHGLPRVEGKVELNVPDAPKSKIKDISSQRRIQSEPPQREEEPKASSEPPLKSFYEALGKLEAPQMRDAAEPQKEDDTSKAEPEAESRLESLVDKFEEGDKDGAYAVMCEESGMDPESPKAKETFEKMWAAVEEAGKPHEHQDLGKLVDYLKTVPPKAREASAHAIMLKAGWDAYDIDRALREVSEVTPAPLPEEDGGSAGGIGAAPTEGEEEGGAKIGASPLDEELARKLREADEQVGNGDIEGSRRTLLDWLKEKRVAGKLGKTVLYTAITIIFAYIWTQKMAGGLSQMKK